MASVIKIKRSGTAAGAPASLKSGELAYTYTNGVHRLYYGKGDDGSGNATEVVVIGGQYFTDLLDHNLGTLTASSAILTDANSKIDNLKVDNIDLNGNTITSTDSNGNLILDANGTGKISFYNAYTFPKTLAVAGYALVSDGAGGLQFSPVNFSNTATNIANGTAGQVPYQSAVGITSFYGPGTAGDLLVSGGTGSPTYQNTLTLAGTVQSSSTNTGALQVRGGAGIGGNLYIGGLVNVTGQAVITDSTNATSTSTGALQIVGGVGVGKDLYVGGASSITGIETVLNTTNATSTSTGALQVRGGVGIGLDLYVGGTSNFTGISTVLNTTQSSSTSTGALQVRGGAGIAGNLNLGQNLSVDGTATINDTTDSSSTTTGAVKIAGGLGVGKNLFVGGTLSIASSSTFYGDLLPATDGTINIGSPSQRFGTLYVSSGSINIGGQVISSDAFNYINLPKLKITENVASNSTITGALIITGGIGAGGVIWANNVKITDTKIGFGNQAGSTAQGTSALAVGHLSGFTNQGDYGVALGYNAGYGYQGQSGIAIGKFAGNNTQGTYAIAIGDNAGYGNQGTGTVAIGKLAGSNTQGANAIAIGEDAGLDNQGSGAVAIGFDAGSDSQGVDAVAIGNDAAVISQFTNAVAVGAYAGNTFQGTASIAIGYQAGYLNQHRNTVIINATGSQLNSVDSNRFYLAPIRSNSSADGILQYNPSTKEVTYNNTVNGAIVVDNGTTSNSTSSGALQVRGGVGIAENLNVGGTTTLTGQVDVNDTTNATSTTTGALIVAGGLAVVKDIFVGGEIIAQKLTIEYTTVTTNLVTTDDIIKTQNTETSVSATSGALQVAGGGGFAKDLFVGGNITATNVYANFIGNATSADKWSTARTITLAGDLGGSITVDGTSDLTFTATIQANSVALGTDTTGDYVSNGATTGFGLSGSTTGENQTFTVSSNATSSNVTSTLVFRDGSGNISVSAVVGDLVGTATSATNIYGGATGSIPYQSDVGNTVFLGLGSPGKVLQVSTTSNTIVWGDIDGGVY